MKKKQDMNTSYGGKIVHGDNARLAIKIADRAIQQTIDADELESRLVGLFEPEVIEMACEAVSLLLESIENDRLSEVRSAFEALCDIREDNTWNFQDDVISHVRVL